MATSCFKSLLVRLDYIFFCGDLFHRRFEGPLSPTVIGLKKTNFSVLYVVYTILILLGEILTHVLCHRDLFDPHTFCT